MINDLRDSILGEIMGCCCQVPKRESQEPVLCAALSLLHLFMVVLCFLKTPLYSKNSTCVMMSLKPTGVGDVTLEDPRTHWPSRLAKWQAFRSVKDTVS